MGLTWRDAHVHLFWPDLDGPAYLRAIEGGTYTAAQRGIASLTGQGIESGLVFGYPWQRGDDLTEINRRVKIGSDGQPWLAVAGHGTTGARYASDPSCAGLKPYPCYSAGEAEQAGLDDYLTEISLDAWAERGGIIMAHCMQEDGAVSRQNERVLRRYAAQYPRLQFVLAHLGRASDVIAAVRVGQAYREVDNIWFDTAAVVDPRCIAAVAEIAGTERLLWGSDFPVTHLQGHTCLVQPDGTRELPLLGTHSMWAVEQAAIMGEWDAAQIRAVSGENFLRLTHRVHTWA